MFEQFTENARRVIFLARYEMDEQGNKVNRADERSDLRKHLVRGGVSAGPSSLAGDSQKQSRELCIVRKRAYHEIEMERFLIRFACRSLGCICLATLVLFYLQGFHPMGFSLDAELMRYIGTVGVGAIAGASTIVYKAMFRRRAMDAVVFRK